MTGARTSTRGRPVACARMSRFAFPSMTALAKLLPDACVLQEDLPVCEMSDDPLLKEVLTVCKAADERKADNIVAIRVRGKADFIVRP